MYVHSHISKTTCPNFSKFSVHTLPEAMARSFSDGSAINILCTSGFVDYVMFSHSGAESVRRRCVWSSSPRGGTNQRPRRAALILTGAKFAILDCFILN